MLEPLGGEARGRESVVLFVVSCIMSSQIIQGNLLMFGNSAAPHTCVYKHRKCAVHIRFFIIVTN